MILQKWNEALIDWVNCLSLTDRIRHIEELKNGVFFRLLLKKLTSSEGLIECTSESFDDVYISLEKEFPLYGVRDIEKDDSQLSYIASLLLLLSVTKEETPMFQSNLCEHLSHDSQVKIKCFLESCLESTNELNHSYLKTVIEGDAVSRDNTSTKVKDNLSVKTPMKDFFDSPRQTSKLKRDLKRLETENETLLVEKLELEDELRIEKEKRQRIEDALSQKNEQVLKLREELQDFIQNSNSDADEHNTNSQSVSTIKSELKELEVYVTTLQDEKSALSDEKEKLLEKITTLQTKNKDLESQIIYSESKQQELLRMLCKRDEEVSSLREHCMELEEKINALPTAHNTTIESDTSLPLGNISSPFGGERLSHAVVDVKLAEVEEENEKFRDQVKMLINQCETLTHELKKLGEELDKERKEGENSREKLDSMTIDMQSLRKSNASKELAIKELQDLLNEKTKEHGILSSGIEKIMSEKEILISNIASLHDNIRILEETKEDMLTIISNSKLELLEMSGKLTALESSLESKEKLLESLREELTGKDVQVENMKSEIKKGKEEVERINKLMEETLALKEKESEELREKVISKEMMVAKFEDDVVSKELVIEELRGKLKEQTNLISSLELMHESLREEKKSLESELEQTTLQVKEKECVAERVGQEMFEYRAMLEKMTVELSEVKDESIFNVKSLKEIENQLFESNEKIKSMEEREVAMETEKKVLESSLISLKAYVKLMEETKDEILKENSHYKGQVSDCGKRISELEIKLEEQERKLECLTNELSSKNNLVEQMVLSVKDGQVELESMKKQNSSCEETISVKKKENEELKQQIVKIQGTVNSLEADKECLMIEKQEVLSKADEQKVAVDVLQQKMDSLNEEKMILESKISWWKAQCEAFEKILEEIKLNGHVDRVENINSEKAVKYKMISNGTENDFVHSIPAEKAMSEEAAAGSNLKNLMVQTNCDYKNKNGNFNEDDGSFSSENTGLLIDATIDEEKLRHLDVEKLLQLINSWHDIDASLEKLNGVESQLKAKICSLWESVPRIQSKLAEKSNIVASDKEAIKETGPAKEVIMRIITMVRSLEKNNSSLEKDLLHASSNAVSWGLERIQSQFNVVTSTPNAEHTNSDVNFKGEQKGEFCSFLDNIRDKLSQVLEDVNSSEEIFKEIERRSANASEALEYLKKNCLYEKELLSDVDYERFQVLLTENETKERFIRAMDEMERAKENLERIANESRKEIESLQNEKENLEKELQSMAARCSLLESKLEMSGKHVELAVQETQQRIQKIFEKKLEATKEKWKSIYMDDLKKHEEECKLRKQFEENFKKYRSLAEEYEKKFADANSQREHLKSKVQNLQHQKSCLEMKLKESRARTFMEDDHRDSLDSGVYRINDFDVMANYFARKNPPSPSHTIFDSHGDTNRDGISRSFSRESVQSSLPTGMGQVFCAEDEEGELFNATYLNDLNEGKCIVTSNASNAEARHSVLRERNNASVRNPTYNEDTPNKRLKELMRRNTLCLPHLKSSYPTETQFHDPKNFSEELVKGSEQGSEQGKIPSTPGRFRAWFARGKKTVPNGDVENIPFTPRTKQKGLFQRAMANLDRDAS